MRARNIKPGFFENEHLADCDPLARILFAGLWCMADRAGRLEDRPKKIKVKILPYDECSVEDLLNQLEQYGFITRYIVNNQRYIQIDNFGRHQNPHCKEAESTIPAPCQHSASTVQTQEEPRKGFPELKEGDGERQDHPGSTQEASVADGQSKNKEQQETSGKSTFNKEHSASTVQAPEEHRSSPADSLIPDSGFSDSLIPDSKRERGTHVPPVDEYVAEIKTTDENKPLNIKQAQSERWQQKFRFIDVEAELYRLSQWAEQNPE
ncbi:MAG: hypothetical protein ACOCQT_00225, partial [Desulfovermiculus sp.]